MTKTTPSPFAAILADSPERIKPLGQIRREPRKVIAAHIRALLKARGIKGVSVTAPNYSMAQSVDIRLPEAPEHDRGGSHDYASCPICQERNRACRHLETLILAAFPDLDNRSDMMTDYFDYRLSIH